MFYLLLHQILWVCFIFFLKNTESQMHEEEGGAGSGKVRDATEKGD